jgi:hypothetical protein
MIVLIVDGTGNCCRETGKAAEQRTSVRLAHRFGNAQQRDRQEPDQTEVDAIGLPPEQEIPAAQGCNGQDYVADAW